MCHTCVYTCICDTVPGVALLSSACLLYLKYTCHCMYVCTHVFVTQSQAFCYLLLPGCCITNTRVIACLQVIFRKRATNYRALLQRMTYKDKGYCITNTRGIACLAHIHMYRYTNIYMHMCVCERERECVDCNRKSMDCCIGYCYRVAKTQWMPKVAGHFPQKSH